MIWPTDMFIYQICHIYYSCDVPVSQLFPQINRARVLLSNYVLVRVSAK